MSKALEIVRKVLETYGEEANWRPTYLMHGQGAAFMPRLPAAHDNGASARAALAALDGADPSEVSGTGGAGAK
jgi:hypothetical protein